MVRANSILKNASWMTQGEKGSQFDNARNNLDNICNKWITAAEKWNQEVQMRKVLMEIGWKKETGRKELDNVEEAIEQYESSQKDLSNSPQ